MRYAELEQVEKKAEAEAISNLKELNKTRTLDDLGAEMGFSKQYLSNVIHGRVGPSKKLLKKLLG